jgi:hypothetical protein
MATLATLHALAMPSSDLKSISRDHAPGCSSMQTTNASSPPTRSNLNSSEQSLRKHEILGPCRKPVRVQQSTLLQKNELSSLGEHCSWTLSLCSNSEITQILQNAWRPLDFLLSGIDLFVRWWKPGSPDGCVCNFANCWRPSFSRSSLANNG